MSDDSVELVREARNLLLYSDPATAGLWPRAASLLARQDLEGGLRRFWLEHAPGVENCSTHAQLLCLPNYLDPEVARKAEHAWVALSRASHHHPYELAPTEAELRAWIDDVEDVLSVISVGGRV